MKPNIVKLLVVAATMFWAQRTWAQPYSIDWHTMDIGGLSTGGGYSLRGGIAQAGASLMSGDGFTLEGGFSDLPEGSLAPEPIAIFDNSTGSENGVNTGDPSVLLAGRFCLGSQSFALDSVTLFLHPPGNDVGQRPVIRLEIYSADLVTGLPAANTGVLMNLAGATNPVAFKLVAGTYTTPFTWTNATPFILLANRCYWAVLKVDAGRLIYAVSSTPPTGAAGAFGRTESSNGGATWTPTVNVGDNGKMLIRATPVPTPVQPVTIFDNARGSENGGFGVRLTTWIASRFCPGPQPYLLDSVSLLLSNGTFDGQPIGFSSFRLQIYTSDPVSGKPSTSTGVMMNLSGMSNSFEVHRQWVKWTNSTPFLLSADTCYWAVLSLESGASAGPIASFTKPTGDAGAFGLSITGDSGATWGTPDLFTNIKMMIQGFAAGAPAVSPSLAADRSTAIPGGAGNFANLPIAPSLNGPNLAYYGLGSDGKEGLYLSTRGPLAASRIADFATAIPGGVGNFTSFGAEVGIIIVSGSTAIFAASGAGGLRGVYGTSLGASIGLPYKLVDTATAIPGGNGNFIAFPNGRSVSGNNVVFLGAGAGGKQGIYGVSTSANGPPYKIADTTTAIPGGSGNFTAFSAAPSLSGDNVVFAGTGAGAQSGVYGTSLGAISPPFKIADTTTTMPGSVGNFTSFGTEAGIIIVSGKTAVFGGIGASGRRGIYGANLVAAAARTSRLQVAGGSQNLAEDSISAAGPAYRIVDSDTPIPDGTGNFTGFGPASIHEEDVAFLGKGAGGQIGIYLAKDGQLRKIIAVGKAIQGKQISGLSFSREGFSEEGLAFQAMFGDGSQGVYRMDLPATTLRIAGTRLNEQALRFSFPTTSGQNYAIESRADLATGSWGEVPGTAAAGNGATQQIVLPISSTELERYYRVRQLP